MACFNCSKFKSADQDIIKEYRGYYEKNGKEFYIYRLKKNGGAHIVNKNSFNTVFERDIKPNFKNGAEYFHISEFKT
ncbi:MAG: hypothetical protein ACUZ8H_01405 [Candidatus Anammoxibacter sp.]